jgi:hypothetical protein
MSSQEVSPPNKKQKRQVSGDRGRPGTANGNSNSNGAGPSNGSAPAGAVLPPGYAQGAPLPGNPTPNGMGRPPPPGGQIMMPAQRPIVSPLINGERKRERRYVLLIEVMFNSSSSGEKILGC